MIYNYRIGDIVLLKETSLQVDEDKLAYVYRRYYGNPSWLDNNPNVTGISLCTIDGEIIPFIPIEEYKQSLIFVTESFFRFERTKGLNENSISKIIWCINNMGYTREDYKNGIDFYGRCF